MGLSDGDVLFPITWNKTDTRSNKNIKRTKSYRYSPICWYLQAKQGTPEQQSGTASILPQDAGTTEKQVYVEESAKDMHSQGIRNVSWNLFRLNVILNVSYILHTHTHMVTTWQIYFIYLGNRIVTAFLRHIPTLQDVQVHADSL
jgi:hypothetical protein